MHLKTYTSKILSLVLCLMCFAVVHSASASSISRPQNNLGLVGYWSFEDATGTKATDFSGNGNTGTLNNMSFPGTATSGWGNGKIGKGLNFDGVDDYVDLGSSSVLKSTTTFSAGAWIKNTTTSGTLNIITRGGTGLLDNYNMYILNGVLYFGIRSVDCNSWITASVAFTYTNTWHNVFATYNGTNIKLYIDGVLQNTSSSATVCTSPISNTAIGGATLYSTNHFTGSIDDVRIYSRALSATEVASLYNNSGVGKINKSRLTTNSSLDTGLVGYWTFDGSDISGTTAYDRSGNGNNGTLTNGPTKAIGKVGQALNFNGTNNYVASTNTKKIGLGFVGSISFWAKGSGDVVSNHRTLDGVNVGDGTVIVNTDGTLTYNVDSTALPPWGYSLTTTRSVATSTWNFYTLVLNVPSSTGTLSGTLYINGVAESLSTSITTGGNGAVDANFADIDIGAHRNAGYGTSYFTGSIDEVRIYNRALSASEVSKLYNLNAAKFNTTQQVTGTSLDSGLVGYWSFNGPDMSTSTAYDRSGNGNNGTLTNGPTKAIGKVGQALNFDGLNAGVYTSKPNFTSAGMTISMWIKPNSSFGTNDNFIGVWDNAGWLFRTGFDNPQRIEFYDGATSYETSSSYLTSGVWQYVTVTQDTSGVYRIYYNGTVVYTSSAGMPVPNAGSNANMSIGRLPVANVYSFPGSIDEVRIYNRALSASEVKLLYNLGK